MSNPIHLDSLNCRDIVDAAAWDASLASILSAKHTLESGSGPGSDFLGWVNLPERSRNDIHAIQEQAARIRSESDVLILIGIGGSYLGARAVIEALTPPFHEGFEVLYAGHHINGAYLQALLASLEDKRVSINVISKSGTTTEPALAFRVFKQWMEQRYGRKEASRRIVATTDASRGALRLVAEQERYARFVIPDDVGGRFSVFSPVGLLPISAAGIDIAALLDGAAYMHGLARSDTPDENPALHYAVLRDALYRKGKTIEILASFNPAMQYIAEWWKQLFGESEGKNGRGVFPASVSNTTDLHSLGQYIQDGERRLFETFLLHSFDSDGVVVPSVEDDTDGLNYLAGTTFAEVNRNAWLGTSIAHAEGGVPNASIILERMNARTIGALLYMFQYTVACNGYALGVNPFDQPGVEAYKSNMFALLGKPGYEALSAELRRKLATVNKSSK